MCSVLTSILDFDATCLFGSAASIDAEDVLLGRSLCRSSYFLDTHRLSCLHSIFFLGLLHLCTEGGAALQGAEADTGGRTAGIDVALPVGTHDDTAVAIVPAALEDLVGTLWSYLCKQQGNAPAAQRMAGGIAALAAKVVLLM